LVAALLKIAQNCHSVLLRLRWTHCEPIDHFPDWCMPLGCEQPIRAHKMETIIVKPKSPETKVNRSFTTSREH
jgi:hypothetical protein